MRIAIKILPLLFALSRNAQAQGYIEAVNVGVIHGGISGGVYSEAIVGYVNDATVGWTFSPAEDILVSSLGWLGGSNISNGVVLGLWEQDGTLLRSATVDSSGQMINGSVYEAISPIFLPANETFVVAASNPGQTFVFKVFPNAPTTNSINYISANLNQTGGFSFPATWASAQGFLPATTFLFQSVPEPSAFALTALGGLLLGFRRLHR